MKFFSIKWKLSLALVAIGLGLVGMYVLIAKDTFESDKISYVFENQETQVEAMAKDFDQQIERHLFVGRTILSTYDFKTKTLNLMGQRLFGEQKSFQGIDLRDAKNGDSLFQVEKNPGQLAKEPLPAEGVLKDGTPQVRHLKNHQFLISTQERGEDGLLVLRVLVEMQPAFPLAQSSQAFFLADARKILMSAGNIEDLGRVAQEMVSEISGDRADHAMMKNFEGQKYLISSSSTKLGDFHLASLASEKDVLSALRVLWRRSIIFLVFSTFATILISYFLSTGLTANLAALSAAAIRIGQGNFSSPPTVKSQDEIGVLALAFRKMATEIGRLLLETKDKARMEEELKTARLVQESLFPAVPDVTMETLSMSGLYVTSTECGGDWWYYFRRGDELYVVVADATGHGTPAALITAAARSLFSKLEHSNESLLEIAKDWDHATASSSGKKVYMTAFLLKINVKTGAGTFVNACHEPPILMSAEGTGEYLAIEKGSTLGEGATDRCVEQPLELKPGERLILFTDGMFAVENKEGKTYSDLRFLKAVQKLAAKSPKAQELASAIHEMIENHRQGVIYPDDVTLVVIERHSES